MGAYEEFGCGSVGVKEVTREAIKKYCTLDVTPVRDNIMKVNNIIEKPTEEQILSLYASLGRVILTPEIFGMLEDGIAKHQGGEFYLTDALADLGRADKLTAVDFIGKRYDMGNKLGIMMANCEVALDHPEIGADFRAYLKDFAKTL